MLTSSLIIVYLDLLQRKAGANTALALFQRKYICFFFISVRN